MPASCVDARTGGTRPAAEYSLSLHAFEPVPANANLLRGGMAALLKEAPGVKFAVHQAAVVGNPNLTSVSFGDCPAGVEKCGVASEAGMDEGLSTGLTVEATTVDAWLAREGLDRLDVLAIDAEGHDPQVLRGAEGLLRRGGARIVEFEYHLLREWSVTQLQDVVEWLDGFGYDCFFLQRGSTALRLTGCWHPSYEVHRWSNVLCVARREAGLLAVMNAFTPLSRPLLRGGLSRGSEGAA